LYYCSKEDGPNGTEYPIELEGTGTTASKNRIGGLPSVVYEVAEIAAAYKKWGIKDESIASIPATEKPPAEIETKAEEKVIHQSPPGDDILADMMNS
jgi:hypothetical protein